MEEGLVGFVRGKEWTRHDPVDDDWRGNRDWLIGIGGKLGDSLPRPRIEASMKLQQSSSIDRFPLQFRDRFYLLLFRSFLFIRGTTKRLNLAPYIHPRRKNTSFDFHSTKKRACNCYSIRLAITVFFFFFLVKSYTSRPSSHQFITGKLISRILVESNQLLNSIPVYFSIPFRSFAYFSRVVINRRKEPVEINYSREKKGYF